MMRSTEDKVAAIVSAQLLKDESFVRKVSNIVVEQNRIRKVVLSFYLNFKLS
jgi:hypothetical protein